MDSQRKSAAGPLYLPVADEITVFRAAHEAGLSVMLKGPTGVGKTRLVEAMAYEFGRPLIAVACHEDLTAADLTGRYLLKGGDTVWEDGPLTRAVREGAICYLDEVVEARADTIVVLHPLLDHRRQLVVGRLGEVLEAGPEFMLVVSFNPGYQSLLKDMKPSTRQRLVSIELGFPPPEVESEVVRAEAGVSIDEARVLVKLAAAIRNLKESSLMEAASTRAIVAAGKLMRQGLSPRQAARAAIVGPLTDDEQLSRGLAELVDAYLA